MKTRRFVVAATLLTATTLSAQIVNDGATRVLSNVTNTITRTLTIGTNGLFTLLTLADNALLTNSAHGVIGLNTTANSNAVRLTSGSARWLMGGTLFVGSNGPFSTLVVSNGASAQANTGIIGSRAASGSNLVLVTGSGSVWSNAIDVSVGSAGPGKLVIEAGGRVHGDSGRIGGSQSASNTQALVTGPGSLWNNVSFLTIGNNAGHNRLVVSNGATVLGGNGAMGSTSTAPSNQVVVTGAGSVWSNRMLLTVGGSSAGNRVEVRDGGRLAAAVPAGDAAPTGETARLRAEQSRQPTVAQPLVCGARVV
jgi:T5SS/PEP-CTERM-associated repeat protein